MSLVRLAPVVESTKRVLSGVGVHFRDTEGEKTIPEHSLRNLTVGADLVFYAASETDISKDLKAGDVLDILSSSFIDIEKKSNNKLIEVRVGIDSAVLMEYFASATLLTPFISPGDATKLGVRVVLLKDIKTAALKKAIGGLFKITIHG